MVSEPGNTLLLIALCKAGCVHHVGESNRLRNRSLHVKIRKASCGTGFVPLARPKTGGTRHLLPFRQLPSSTVASFDRMIIFHSSNYDRAASLCI